MKNKCEACGLVNFVGAEECKRCKKSLKLSTDNSPKIIQTQVSLEESAGKTSSDSKNSLKVLPFVIFSLPLLFVLKDKMSGEYVKPGGYVQTLHMSILIFCTVGLLISFIYLIATKNK